MAHLSKVQGLQECADSAVCYNMRLICGGVCVQRWMTYLTVLFTLLLPVVGALWARSYLRGEMFYRVGHGRGMMLNCVQGEIALWTGPARESGPVRYGYEGNVEGYSMTAEEALSLDRSARTHWFAGFGYAVTYSMAPVHL